MQFEGNSVIFCNTWTDSGADMCLNCSFSVKSMKFGTETVFKMTKKIGYGGKPETAVLPS